MIQTIIGWIPTIIIAIVGSGAFVKFVVDPWLRELNNRKQYATALWLSCLELRVHFSEIKEKCEHHEDNDTKQALRKIPDWDFMKASNKAAWFTERGYFCMITAYKIAYFSSLMRLYEDTLKNSYNRKSRKMMSELYTLFAKYKYALSRDTILWYYYIDAIGDKLIINRGDGRYPMDFAAFCRKYYKDEEFRMFFQQLHMFIHFLGRNEDFYIRDYINKIPLIISKIDSIEEYLKKENLIKGAIPTEDRTTTSKMNEKAAEPPK